MKYKGIIFDLDGVLVFTDRYHYQAWKLLADRLGVYFDEVINERLRGVSRMESLEIMLERWEGEPFATEQCDDMATEKNECYRKLLANMTPQDIPQQVRDMLTKLRQDGVRLAIGSSSKNTAYIMERTALSGYFDAVADGNDITRSKPDPEVFLLAAERLGLPPADCLVVEDAVAGVDAALAGGFAVAGIGGVATSPLVHHSLADLCQLLTLA